MRRRTTAHTLVELLVALAIVGILGALANASYVHFVLAARRFDARAALAAVAASQERHRLRHATYAARLSVAPPGVPPAAEVPGTLPLGPFSPDEHYVVTIAGADVDGYTLEARPRGGQRRDRDCALFVLESGGLRRAESASGADTTRRCWSGA